MSQSPQKAPFGVAPVMERNIEALLARRQADHAQLNWQEKLAMKIAQFMGSMIFVYLHLFLYGLWIAINCGGLPILPRFDPTLVILAMIASVEAIFLSSFILINQNRMMAQADRRADLSLQISLLAEHEITRLLGMVKEMGARQDIEAAKKPDLEKLTEDVAPEEVLKTLDQHEKSLSHEPVANEKPAVTRS